jgi:hypothetical protein
MTQNKIAGDSDRRSDAQWLGDVAHMTMERLEKLQPELETLAKQFALLRQKWCYIQGASSAAFMLERFEAHLYELAGVGAPDSDGSARAVLRGIIADTGRPKQDYHHYDDGS